jgi:hypothetical protein
MTDQHELTPDPPATTDLEDLADRIQQTSGPGRPGRAGRRWLPPLVAAGLVTAVVAATAVVVTTAGRDAPTSTPSPHATATSARPGGQIPTPSEDQLARANDLLVRWERVVGGRSYVPIGSSDMYPAEWEFQQVGHWPDSNGKDRPSFIALALRQIVSGIPLATTSPAAGTITWADGTTQPTDVRPAKATFDHMRTAAVRCAKCPPGTFDGITARTLTITRASLTTMQVTTTRGRATVPAWRFQFADSPVQVLQAAVATPLVGPAPQDPRHPIDAQRIDSAELATDGRTLTVSYVGGMCGDSGHVAHAIETDHAVGIILVPRPPHDSEKTRSGDHGGDAIACPAIGVPKKAAVRLGAPLNGRAVLETVQGTAVPVGLG